MNKSYTELLNSPEWRLKRKEIIARDNRTCQRCGVRKNSYMNTRNYKFPDKHLSYPIFNFYQSNAINKGIVEIKMNKFKILCKTDLKNIVPATNYALFVNKLKIKQNKIPFQGSILNNTKANIFHSKENSHTLANYLSKVFIKNNSVKIDPEGIWFGKYEERNYYTKNLNTLEVHHKCYRKGIDIWDQPDEDYVALCNICHIIVHETIDIPFFDINGVDYRLRRICSKCHGIGILNEFRHVENGRCFKCDGRGFVKINT